MSTHDCLDPECGTCHICQTAAHKTSQHNDATQDLQYGVPIRLYLNADGYLHCPHLDEVQALLHARDEVFYDEAFVKNGDPIEIEDHIVLTWSPTRQTWILDRLP